MPMFLCVINTLVSSPGCLLEWLILPSVLKPVDWLYNGEAARLDSRAIQRGGAMIKIIRHSKRLARTSLVVLFSVMIGVACNMALMAQQNPYVQLNRRPYFVIFFVKGEAWAQPRTKEETDRLLRGHLAYLRKHVESGQNALSGPLNDDGPVRGIIVLGAGTAEEAARIVKRRSNGSEPAVWRGSPSRHVSRSLGCAGNLSEKRQ